MTTAFGTALKTWRGQRRMSQMELGLSANVSARHISFLETGRARPSRSMVLQLCEELDVPRQARNRLLTSAGLAPAYSDKALSDEDLKPARAAVDWILERHDPFPALALDRHWTIIKMNRSSTLLMSGLGLKEGDSLLAAVAEKPQVIEAIENFDEVAEHLVTRLRTESAHLGGDAVLDAAAERLAALAPSGTRASEGVLPPFVPTRYRAGSQVFSFFSTFSQFGTAEDIALSELKIEMMFPADEETRALLFALGGTQA
ncbi:MAG: helix-turn-helix domain-containing protein [Pseudomonadota bacterium]